MAVRSTTPKPASNNILEFPGWPSRDFDKRRQTRGGTCALIARIGCRTASPAKRCCSGF